MQIQTKATVETSPYLIPKSLDVCHCFDRGDLSDVACLTAEGREMKTSAVSKRESNQLKRVSGLRAAAETAEDGFPSENPQVEYFSSSNEINNSIEVRRDYFKANLNG